MKALQVVLVSISLILSILIGLTIARGKTDGVGSAAGESRTPDDQLVIGLSLDTLKEARWQRDRDSFVKRVEALGGKVIVQSANSDDTRQARDVQSLISAGVDALVIVPHDGRAMAKGVRDAKNAGIPVMAYDRLIVDCPLDLYMTFDNVRVGEMQGRYLVENLSDKRKPWRIVRMYGAPTDNNAKLFKQGQDNVLAPYIERGDIKVVFEDWVLNWDPQNAKKIMNAAINKVSPNGFDAVLASNDGTAGGAIQSLKEEGLAGKRLVTGQDADLVACQRILAGTQTMTVYKPLSKLASQAAEIAVKLAAGKPIIARDVLDNGAVDVPSIFVDVIALDKTNMNLVIEDKFHSREELYGSAATAPAGD